MNPIRVVATWLALMPLRLLGHVPLPLGRMIARPLAWPMRQLMRRRRKIAGRNLEMCFPELEPSARNRLLRRHFRNLAESVAEIAVAWCRPGRLHHGFGRVVGLEHLSAARADGSGVVLVTGHTSCLELGARLFGEQVEAKAIYRPLRNRVLERFQNRGRRRYASGMIPRDDLRAMVRHLRTGGVLWYAPDQDLGAERSEFAPFFGVPTATATATVELARLGRAKVVPMYPVKDEATGLVTVYLDPELYPFPSNDLVDDLTRINQFLENRIRQAPAQYWWLHRRFKTRPPGTGDPYADV